MNKVYKVVWSSVRHAYIVVSELTRAKGKTSRRSEKTSPRGGLKLGICMAAMVLAALHSGVYAQQEAAAVPADQAVLSAGKTSDIPAGTITETEDGKSSGSIAIGNSTVTDTKDSLAIGNGAKVESTTEDLSEGSFHSSPKDLGGMMAIGKGASVTDSVHGIAVGSNAALDTSANGIVVGRSSYIDHSDDSSVIGAGSNITNSQLSYVYGGLSHIADSEGSSITGYNSYITLAPSSVAIGNQVNIKNDTLFDAEDNNSPLGMNVAIGATSGLTNSGFSVAVGYDTHVNDASSAVALGSRANVYANAGTALGMRSEVDTGSTGGTALGYLSTIGQNAAGSTALGFRSAVKDNVSFSVALGNYSVASEAGTVSVGWGKGENSTYPDLEYNRRITHVGDGKIEIGSHDAVTGGQLAAAGIIPGTVTNTKGGDNYTSVAMGAGNTMTDSAQAASIGSYTTVDTSMGASVLGFSTDVTNSDYTVGIGHGVEVTDSTYSVAVGARTEVTVTDSVKSAYDPAKHNGVSVETYYGLNVVSGAGSTIKNSGQATATGASSQVNNAYGGTAYGYGTLVSGDYGTAIGYGSRVGDSGETTTQHSVALGAYSKVDADDILDSDSSGVVSVGRSASDYSRPAFTRRIINVADGVNTSDAATVKQIQTATGGTFTDGKYSLKIGDTTYDSVAEAINAVSDSAADNAVVYSTKDDGTVNKSNVTLEGENGTTLTNLADGKIKAGSKDAVTGGQLAAAGIIPGRAITSAAMAIGDSSKATGTSSTALGAESQATGNNGTSVGNDSIASGLNSTAIGSGSRAEKDWSTALGKSSWATGKWSTAIGGDSQATGEQYSTAVGQESRATANTSTAVGATSKALGIASTALGMTSKAEGKYGTAIGSYSQALAAGSVALGYGSYTAEADILDTDSTDGITYGVISVGQSGDDGFTRRIINVKDGVNGSDAATVGQIRSAIGLTQNDEGAYSLEIDGTEYTTVADAINAVSGSAADNAVVYDTDADGNTDKSTVTLEGENGTTLTNLADGKIEAGSKDAVTGGQLAAAGIIPGTASSNSVAIGTGSSASAGFGVAIGVKSSAANGGVAVGYNSKASVVGNTAVGDGSTASGQESIAFGYKSQATGFYSTAIGYNSEASGSNSLAVGRESTSSGSQSVAIGNASKVEGADSVAVGHKSSTTSYNAVAIGSSATAGMGATTLGASSNATGQWSTAIGFLTTASDAQSTALGYYSKVESGATGSVALGAQSRVKSDDIIESDNSYRGVISVGQSGDNGFTRRIINVKDGVNASDATTVGQLTDVTGATLQDGAFSFNVGETTYTSISKAMNALDAGAVKWDTDAEGKTTNTIHKVGLEDGKVTADNGISAGNGKFTVSESGAVTVKNKITANALQIGSGEHALVVDSFGQISNGAFSADREGNVRANSLNVNGKDYITANGINANSQQITNVADGKDAADAVNKGQLDAGLQEVTDLTDGINIKVGSADFSRTAYVKNAENVTQAIYGLDGQVKTNADAITSIQGTMTGLDGQAVKYDTNEDGTVNTGKVTLQGDGGTTLTGLKDGTIAKGSTDAVTGGQLAAAGMYPGSVNDATSVAMGNNSQATGKGSTAVGENSQATGGLYSIAVGYNSKATANGSTAIGVISKASGVASTAIGTFSQVEGIWGTALGTLSQAKGMYSTAAGSQSIASAEYSTAIGFSAQTLAANGTALGRSSEVDEGAEGSVAIGYNSSAREADILDTESTYGVISVGSSATTGGFTRRIINVSDGVNDSDAATVGQIMSVTGATLNSSKKLTFDFSGTNYLTTSKDLAAAVKTLDSQIKSSADTLGNAVVYDGEDKSIVTLKGEGGTTLTGLKDGSIAEGSKDAVTGGQLAAAGMYPGSVNDATSVAMGNNSQATGRWSTAVGGNSQATGAQYSTAVGYNSKATVNTSTAIGAISKASGFGSTAIGMFSQVEGMWGTALGTLSQAEGMYSTAAGSYSTASAENSTALGRSSEVDEGAEGSVAIGYNSSARENDILSGESTYGVVSVGSSATTGGFTRRIINVSDGVNDSDAATVGQLTDVTGATLKDGEFSFKVGETTYSDISSAMNALDTQLTENATAVDTFRDAGIVAGTVGDGTVKSISLGDSSHVYADESTAVGMGAYIGAGADGSTAMGHGAYIADGAEKGLAIGDSSQVTAYNAVALGAGSVANRSNTVSVGNGVTNRQIINVAAGTEDTDAVNVKQLNDAMDEINQDVTTLSAGAVQYGKYDDGSWNYGTVALQGSAYQKTDTGYTGGTSLTNVAYADGTDGSAAANVDYVKDSITAATEGAVKWDTDAGKITNKINGVELDNGKVTADTVTANNGISAGGGSFTVNEKGDLSIGGGKFSVDAATGNVNAGSVNVNGDLTIKGESVATSGDITAIKDKLGSGTFNNGKGTYTDAINQNTADITANKDAIATNTQHIGTIQGQIGAKEDGSLGLANNGATLVEGINTNTESINTLKTTVGSGELANGAADLTAGVNANTDAIAANSQNIALLGGSVNKLGNRLNRVGAGAAALAALHPLDFDPDVKWDFAAGYGNYRGANAAAVGAYYRPNEDLMFSVGGSFGGGENMVNAGVSVKLGSGSGMTTSRAAMAAEIRDLKAGNDALSANNKALTDKVAQQDSRITELETQVQALIAAMKQ